MARRLEGERAVLIHLAQSLTEWFCFTMSQLQEELLEELMLRLADGIIIV